MDPTHRAFVLVSMTSLLVACGSPHFLTETIYDSPEATIRLQAVPDANQGQGFSHPAVISKAKMEEILKGLVVELSNSALPSGRLGRGERHRAFTGSEARFLAPLLSKSLSLATPEELVTFYETAEISSSQRVITSGGILVRGNELHIVLSNYRVKADVWQDTEHYEAPYRMRPLRPIHPEPGQLSFEPRQSMVAPAAKAGLGSVVKGQSLHVAINFRELAPSPDSERPMKAPARE
jgi:hypothetical protein